MLYNDISENIKAAREAIEASTGRAVYFDYMDEEKDAPAVILSITGASGAAVNSCGGSGGLSLSMRAIFAAYSSAGQLVNIEAASAAAGALAEIGAAVQDMETKAATGSGAGADYFLTVLTFTME